MFVDAVRQLVCREQKCAFNIKSCVNYALTSKLNKERFYTKILDLIPSLNEDRSILLLPIMMKNPELYIVDRIAETQLSTREYLIIAASARVDIILKKIHSFWVSEVSYYYLINNLLFNSNVDVKLLKTIDFKTKNILHSKRNYILMRLAYYAINSLYLMMYDKNLQHKKRVYKQVDDTKIIYIIDSLPTNVNYISLIGKRTNYNIYKYLIDLTLKNLNLHKNHLNVSYNPTYYEVLILETPKENMKNILRYQMNDDIWQKSFDRLLYLFNIPMEYLLFNEDKNNISLYYDSKKHEEIIKVINKIKSVGEYKIKILYVELPENYQQELSTLGVDLWLIEECWPKRVRNEE